MGGWLGRLPLLALVIAGAACTTFPDGAYYPSARDPHAAAVARSLHRAALAADDDPKRYTFAMIHTRDVAAYTTDDASFYFTDGLARLPAPSLDGLVAQQVAHEILGHIGRRRALSLSMAAGFTLFGFIVPGIGTGRLPREPARGARVYAGSGPRGRWQGGGDSLRHGLSGATTRDG